MKWDRTPEALIIWGCFLKILMVVLFQFNEKRKAVNHISVFVIVTVVSNTALLYKGPIREITDLHLRINVGELTQHSTCMFLAHFLHTSIVYTMWTGIAWLLQTFSEFVSPRKGYCLLPKKELKTLCAVFGMQSVFVTMTLLYHFPALPSNNDHCFHHNWFYKDNNVSLYFFIKFGLPVFAFLFCAVYITSKTGIRNKKTSKLTPYSLEDQDNTTNLALLAISGLVFLCMMIPASFYMAYLSTEFNDISKSSIEYRLVFYKYALTNLALYCLTLHILMLHMFMKKFYVQETTDTVQNV